MAEVKHYGVPGMRWGKRKGGGSVSVAPGVRGALKEVGGLVKDAVKDDISKVRSALQKRADAKKPSADFLKTKDLRKKPVQKLSNDELKAVINRLQLEKQFKDLNGTNVKQGNRFVSGMIQKFGAMAINAFARQAAGPDYAGYQTFAQAVKNKAKGN